MVIAVDDLMTHRSMAALTLVQKHIYHRVIISLPDRLVTLILNKSMTAQQLTSLVSYVIQVVKNADAEIFLHLLVKRLPKFKERLMTLAQHLEQKTRNIGLKTGIEAGIKKGINKGIKQDINKGIKRVI